MNILILTNNDSGVYQFRKELLEKLVINNSVICCTPDEDGYIPKIESTGCKVVLINFNRRSINPIEDINLLKDYIHIIKESQADIVLTYTIKPNVYGGIACQRLRIPYIANVTGLGTTIENGGLLSQISLFLYRVGLRKAKKVYFQNKQNCELFKKNRIVRTNYHVLPGSGVNINTHKFEEYPSDMGLFHFLFIGRMMKDKGIEELLEALVLLIKNKYKVFLDIVGYYDEDYTECIEKYEKLGYLQYHGIQQEVHPYYTMAHCVVLPSYHEGMANGLLEAASVGRPIIATRIPGCIETFEEKVTGLGCEVKNVESLYKAMEEMINLPWEKRRDMGIAGHQKVKKEFDRNVIVCEYLKEIEYLKTVI